MAKILIVEDDANLAMVERQYLEVSGYKVEVAGTGKEALDLLTQTAFDAVVLDLGLPELHGLDVLLEFRAYGGAIPILVLTAQNTLADKEEGFQAGADDYLIKPFDMKELRLRLAALLRRHACNRGQRRLACGNLSIDLDSGMAYCGTQEIRLLRSEYNLLEFLMRFPNHDFSVEDLLDHVWKADASATPTAVRTCMARLRKKLTESGCPPVIVTDFKKGYRLEMPT